MLTSKSIKLTQGDPPSDLLPNQLWPEQFELTSTCGHWPHIDLHLRFTGIYRTVKFRVDDPEIRTAKLTTLTSVHIIVTGNICTA